MMKMPVAILQKLCECHQHLKPAELPNILTELEKEKLQTKESGQIHQKCDTSGTPVKFETSKMPQLSVSPLRLSGLRLRSVPFFFTVWDPVWDPEFFVVPHFMTCPVNFVSQETRCFPNSVDIKIRGNQSLSDLLYSFLRRGKKKTV